MLIVCYLSDLGAIATAAPLFLTSRMQSPTPAKYAFLCESNALFPVFERRRGWGKEVFFVNEGEHAGGREEARGLAAGVSLGLQYAE